MIPHTFAVCAYQDSPYLEACIRSLKRQTVPSKIILCTSTPSPFLEHMAERYGLPYYVREGKSDIQTDWNFAAAQADTRLVTIAHQDDCYHRDYGKQVQACWERYPDTTVFMTDCAIIKNGRLQPPGLVQVVKKLLRLPLCLRPLADRPWVKQAALRLGNPVICPSCTYDKDALGTPLFVSGFRFALDWDTMWRLAAQPGRFICEERPLMGYRIHEEATTKKCMDSSLRSQEEAAMYEKIWGQGWLVRVLMHFYRKAYGQYEGC